MTTKRKKIKNNKTKKITYILSDKEKTLNEIIKLNKKKSINDEIYSNLIKFFEVPNSKHGIYLMKNDFYNYIDKLWLDSVIINKKQMKYLIKLDDFRVLQYKVFDKVDHLTNNYISKYSSIVSTELKNYYESSLKLNSIMSSKNFLNKTIKYIDFLRKDKNNLWKMLAFINKNEMINSFAPFSWNFLPDKKNSSQYVNYINPHIFPIFDLSVYEDSSYTKEQRNIYSKRYTKFFINYLKKLFKVTQPEDKSLNAYDVFKTGKEFFRIMGQVDKSIVESDEHYNKVTSEEAIKKYKFNWVEYCKELGYDEKSIPQFFITTSLNYLKFCTELLLENWNTEEWRSYWIWIIVRYVARYTNNWHNIFFTFYGKETEGLLESIRESVKQSAILLTSYAFNPILHNEYIDNYYVEENVVYATDMANNLKNIFINKLNRNTWLEPKTKRYAMFKIQKINLDIGSKKITQEYNKILPLLDFNPDEFLDNLLKVTNWRHNLYINGEIDIIKTLTTYDYNAYPLKITNLPSYIVNAQYIPFENSVKLSTAYLEKPFINIIEQGMEYNLAYIGFTLAHELCHALDDNGSKYDVNGNLYDWWTKNDKYKFKKLQELIIERYKVFSKYDGLEYDTSYTIGEDMADIAGLKLCEEYLNYFCMKNNYTPLITFLHFKIFYVYFSYQMKQKISKQSVRYELISNPHPLDKYRTNVTLSCSSLFKAMYDIKKGDKMYSDDKFCTIWD